jgi:protoheme IX farnesyltransferase
MATKAEAPSLLENAPGMFPAMLELTKPRLSMMTTFSAMLGYLAYQPTPSGYSIFLSLLLGTTLAAGGAAALNQWMERKEDSRMERTMERPLPSGTIHPKVAFWFGLILSGCGLACLFMGVNALVTGLTAATLVVYLVLYTPLKKRTPLATEIGAVSGALPPLMGWAAAAATTDGSLAFGWLLFGILFAWQMPHFMAISWTYRDEYRKAGFIMLAHEEEGFMKVTRKSLFYAFLLGVLAITPVFYDFGSGVALVLSFGLFVSALRFKQANDKDGAARSLFFVTIVHLPLLLTALVIDRYI